MKLRNRKSPSGPASTIIVAGDITQADWYVDSAVGDDDLGNGTETSPFKTLGRLSDELYGGTFKQITTIYIAGDFSNEAFELVASADPDVYILLQGAPNIAASGTLTNFTNLNVATNQQVELEDTTIDFTPSVGKRIRMTSGAALDGISWIAKVDPSGGGTDTARVGVFSGEYDVATKAVSGSPDIHSTIVTPSIGDSYVIENLPSIAGLFIRLDQPYDSLVSPVIVKDLKIASGLATRVDVVSVEVNGFAVFVNCSISGGRVNFSRKEGSFIGASLGVAGVTWPVSGSLIGVYTCVMYGSCIVRASVTVRDVLVQSGSLNPRHPNSSLNISGPVGFFDSAAACVTLSNGGSAVETVSTARIYGVNNSNVILSLLSGLYQMWVGVDPACVGGAGAIRINGANDPAYTRGINATTGSGLVTYAP